MIDNAPHASLCQSSQIIAPPRSKYDVPAAPCLKLGPAIPSSGKPAIPMPSPYDMARLAHSFQSACSTSMRLGSGREVQGRRDIMTVFVKTFRRGRRRLSVAAATPNRARTRHSRRAAKRDAIAAPTSGNSRMELRIRSKVSGAACEDVTGRHIYSFTPWPP
jgi:hypothetical protein